MADTESCLFCKIVNQDIIARIVYEDDLTVAFLDANPMSLGHTLVIPKQHFDKFSDCDNKTVSALASATLKTTQLLRAKLGFSGVNYLINEQKIAGQEIMHCHQHIIPKYEEDTGFIYKVNTKNKIDVDYEWNLITNQKTSL